MGRSLDLRKQALRALGEGMSRLQVCQAFGIHRTTLRRWQIRQAEGRLASARPTGAKRKLQPEDEKRLLTQLVAHPEATLNEHWRIWMHTQACPVSRATLGRAITRLREAQKKPQKNKIREKSA